MSVPIPLLRSGLRAVRPLLDSSRVALGTKRSILDHVVSLARAPEGAIYDFDNLAGLDVQYVTVEGLGVLQGRMTVLYLHGGGNMLGSAKAYRAFAANLATAAGMDVIIPEYPRAPESPYPLALDALTELYLDLPNHGIDHSSVVLVGDASGAGLALSLAMRIRDRGLRQPAAIGLLSPWLDMARDLERNRLSGSDPLMTPSLITRMARPYVGDNDPYAADISPLHGDLSGLPAMVVHYAGQDPLAADAEALLERLVDEEDAPRVISHKFDDMWHGFHLMVGRMALAEDAVNSFGDSLRDLTTRKSLAKVGRVVPINRPVAERAAHLTVVRSGADSRTPTAGA